MAVHHPDLAAAGRGHPRLPAAPASGLSLVELMVALVIGLIVVAGVVQVYASVRHAHRTNEALTQVQETGRFALSVLARDIRMAGYTGCPALGSASVTNIVDLDGDGNPDSGYDLDQTLAIQIGDDVAGGPGGAGSVVAGTDTLTLRFAESRMVPVTSPMTNETAQIQVGGNPYGWGADDVLVITDCERADIFAATSVSAGTGSAVGINIAHGADRNVRPRLSKAFAGQAFVMAFVTRTYYVGETGRTDEHGKPIRALFRQDGTGPAVELAEGVHDMAIRAGVDTNGDGAVDDYVPPATASPDQIVAVSLELWVRSLQDHVIESPRTLSFEGGVTSPGDKRLHVVYSTTVGLRNRLP